MLYQETFQSGENPSEINVSSCVYVNGADQDINKNVETGFPNHCHSFYEIQYFFSGVGETRINGKRIQTVPHSMYLVPPLSVHGQIGHEKSSNLVIQFNYNFLSRNASTLEKNSLLTPAGEMRDKGIIVVKEDSVLERYLQKIAEISPSFFTPIVHGPPHVDYSVEYEWKLNALTLGVICQLMDIGNLFVEHNFGDIKAVIKIQLVLNKLITNPEEKLGMEEAARMACMSYSNFSRTFTQIIGRSYLDYCNDTRVRRAEELLKATNKSITELSQILGFGSTSYFNRIFKNYNGHTPLQYRAEMK
jgi:AraC-like DNA-binding protein